MFSSLLPDGKLACEDRWHSNLGHVSQYTAAEANLDWAVKDKWLFLFMLTSVSLLCIHHQSI